MIGLMRIAGVLAALVVAAATLISAAYAAPAVFFPYAVAKDGLVLRSDRPLDGPAARARLAEVADRLAQSELGAPTRELRFYAAHADWRQRLFFFTVPGAGGVTYAPLSHTNAFLVGIDEGADRIIKGGAGIAARRTLGYYMVHEAVHLMMAAELGTLRYHRLPHWVREGVADYVALGPMAAEARAAVRSGAAGGQATLAQMAAFGSYPLARAQVSDALERSGCTLAALMEMPTQGWGCQWH